VANQPRSTKTRRPPPVRVLVSVVPFFPGLNLKVGTMYRTLGFGGRAVLGSTRAWPALGLVMFAEIDVIDGGKYSR
jgi:hypothetical protein